MARVKRGVTSHAKHKKVSRRQGLITAGARTLFASPSRRSRRPTNTPTATASGEIALSRALDSASQCGGAAIRTELQPLHRWSRQGRCSGRPQDPVRSRNPGACCLRSHCHKSKGSNGGVNALKPISRPWKTVCLVEIAAAKDEAAIEAVRIAALGKNGSVSALLKTLGAMTPAERREHGLLSMG